MDSKMTTETSKNLNDIIDSKKAMKNSIAACKGNRVDDLYSYDDGVRSIVKETQEGNYYPLDFSLLNYNSTEIYLAYKFIYKRFNDFFRHKPAEYPVNMNNHCTSGLYYPYMNTTNSTTFDNCFRDNTDLCKVDGIDMSSATSAKNMFDGCIRLSSITFHYNGPSKLLEFSNMFHNCENLQDLKGLRVAVDQNTQEINILDLQNCHILSYDSLMDIINNLPRFNGKYKFQPILKLFVDSYRKLTKEEADIVRVDKRWGLKIYNALGNETD